jgi:hypothetical protein
MPARTRFQYFPTPKGKIVTGGGLAAGGDYNVQGGGAYCADNTDAGDCHHLDVEHLSIEGGRVNVFNDPNNYWENYRVDYLDVANFSHLSAAIGEDRFDADYATQAAARSNPSRPYIDVPLNLLELGDIARSIQVQGRGLFDTSGRANASSYLRYQFGILPLVTDLVKIARLQDQVQRRILVMDRLEAPNGYRRTMAMGSWENAASYSRVMQSNQYFWTDIVRQTTTQNIRAHVRWLPDPGYRVMSTSDRQRLALRSALGLTIDSSLLWEALPWSWLIDWCSTAGQYFTATRNLIPATLSGVHIMRETRSEFKTDGYINSPIKVVLHTKTRRPSFVAPIAHFPLLTAGQMGIAASLVTTRLR